jgi:hypothetical protein
VDHLLGNWWIIVNGVATDAPECFIMRSAEVSKRAVRDQNKAQAYWLPAKQYQTDEFRGRWDQIGPGDVALVSAQEQVEISPE